MEPTRPEDARQWFERVAANDFKDLPRTLSFIMTITIGADLARRLGDQRRAAVLYAILLPYADRQVTLGNAILCIGSASRPLGALAATLGNWEDAERHFAHALAFDEKIGARPWLARTPFEYAWMLQERGSVEDRGRALDLGNQALATF